MRPWSVFRRRGVGMQARLRTVAALAFVILLLQIGLAVVAVIQISARTDAAVKEAFQFVQGASEERIEEYLANARGAAESLAIEYSEGDLTTTDGSLQRTIYQKFRTEDELRALYVGSRDGGFVILRRAEDSDGYVVRRIDVTPVRQVSHEYYDESFQPLRTEFFEDPYDPRVRPWYRRAETEGGATWTDPYIFYESETPGVTVAQAVREGFNVTAVVGADLQLEDLSALLESLPLGSDGEAFLLSANRDVIAATSGYTQQITDYAKDNDGTIPASVLGVETTAPLTPGQPDSFGTHDGRVTLEFLVGGDEGVEWILHLRASEHGLVPELAAAENLVLWLTIPLILVTLVALTLFLAMLRPLGKIGQQAATDSLTGLASRHEFLAVGHQRVANAIELRRDLVVIAFDLDNFKPINDRFGHGVGDEALRTVGRAIREAVRGVDLAGRLGGDEFALLLELRTDDVDYVHAIVERVRARVERRIEAALPPAVRAGITAGYAVLRSPKDTLERLLKQADEALVDGKRHGKGESHQAGGMRAATVQRKKHGVAGRAVRKPSSIPQPQRKPRTEKKKPRNGDAH